MADTCKCDGGGASASVEEHLRLIIDKIPALVWSNLPDGSLNFLNQRFREYTGLSLEDGLGWGWLNAVHPDDRTVDEWRAAMAAAEPFQKEARLRGTDGKYRWFELRVVPVKDNLGTITHWLGTSTDIGDRKRAEGEVQQLINIVPQYMCVDEANGDVIFANDQLLDFFGLTLEEARAGDFRTRVFHPDDLKRVQSLREDAVAHGIPWEVETRLLRKDGQYRWFLIRFNPLRNESGVVIRWYAAGTDIDDRKQTEAEIRQLVDTLATHVVVLDGEGRRLYANKAVLDYHGFTQEEFLVVDHRKCFHPADLDSYGLRRQSGIASGEPWEAEARLCRKDGQYRWFLVRAKPLRNLDGRAVRWYLARTDIEERKRVEREVQQIVDAVPHHIVVYAADGRRLYPNKVTLDFFDWSVDDFLDDNRVKEVFHPDDLARFYENKDRGILSGAAFQIEARVLRRDRKYRWFLFLFKPFRSEQGDIVRWYATGTDIEDRKQAEDRLRRSEAYLAEAQRLSHTGSFAHDPERGEIIYWSEEAYRTFGFDAAKGPIAYREVRNRIHPEDLPMFEEARERGIREKTGATVDFRIVLPDGAIRHIHCVSRPVMDASGHVVELIGTNMDVTEHHEAEAALQRAFEEIKQLKDRLYRENLALKEEIDQASLFEEIVGSSEPLRRMLVQVTKVAQTESTVLITGETGTGKELIARAIHKRSPRASGAFVSVNCAAVPATLIGSELFGHEKGAFTGATQRRLGRFELADGGTLFLDEVGDLPMETQIALLRVLQERQFERVGGNQPITANARIIAATNRDLRAAIEAGTFRRDLFYRLSVFPIHVPALRERKDDIPLLVEYLTERYATNLGKKISNVEKKTLELLEAYTWPGNIRELQNVIERAVILCDGATLSVDEVWLQYESQPPNESSGGLARPDADRERQLIEAALAESGGRVAGPSGAAAKLGIPRSTLETKIRKLGIKKHRFIGV